METQTDEGVEKYREKTEIVFLTLFAAISGAGVFLLLVTHTC